MKLEARDDVENTLKLGERPFQGSAEHSEYYDEFREAIGPSLVSRVRKALTVENVSATTSLALVLGGIMTGHQILIVPGLGTAALYRAAQFTRLFEEIAQES